MNLKYLAFVISFIFMGCGVDSAFSSGRALIVWIIAAIVFAGTALSIIKE